MQQKTALNNKTIFQFFFKSCTKLLSYLLCLIILLNLKFYPNDNLSRKFVKDGADVLACPISQLCNLSIKLSKIAKAKLFYFKNFFYLKLLFLLDCCSYSCFKN